MATVKKPSIDREQEVLRNRWRAFQKSVDALACQLDIPGAKLSDEGLVEWVEMSAHVTGGFAKLVTDTARFLVKRRKREGE